MRVHQQSSGDGGSAGCGSQSRSFSRAGTGRRSGPKGAGGGSVQPGTGKDHQARFCSKGFACSACVLFTSHLSLPYLLPVFFQSMTQPCLRWETVSLKYYFFTAVSSLLPFNEFFLSFS